MHVFFAVLWHIIQFYRLIIVKKGRTHWSAPTVICAFEENSCLAQLLILNDILPRPDKCGDRRDQLHHRERQPDAIDAERAARSKTRAEEMLAQKNLDKRDMELAEARLKRALVRSSVAARKDI